MKLAIWTETGWALGRIASAVEKYCSADVTVYDWSNMPTNDDLFLRDWHDFDFILSNCFIIPFYERRFKQTLPLELGKKLIVTAHCPRFNLTHFREELLLRPGVHYAGVSRETCRNMNEYLGINNARWLPHTVDVQVFKRLYFPEGPIRRVGYVGARKDDVDSEYSRIKGQKLFEQICVGAGVEAVFISGRTGASEIYEGVDLLICCSIHEGGPCGVFEAAAAGLPVLSTRVGNAYEVPGLATYGNAEEAIAQIKAWNEDLPSLVAYRERFREEVCERWNVKLLIEKHLNPFLQELYAEAEPEHRESDPRWEVPKNGIRLHMLALPHTVTTNEFSHCAFTGKVYRFAPMMRSRGFEVYHYGVETSDSRADKQIDLMSLGQWKELRVKSYQFLHPEKSLEECQHHLDNHSSFIGDLGHAQTPLYKEFNKLLRPEITKHYRSRMTDIICLPFGAAHDPALKDLSVVQVESGIGYPDSNRGYRIFESYAVLHNTLGIQGLQVQNYCFVVPNYYDSLEWPLRLNPEPKTVGFFGRITPVKGVGIVAEVAKHFPNVKFVFCGQGDLTPWKTTDNIVYKAPLSGRERGEYLGSLLLLMAPTDFIEPFCGVAVEAQLCGTPVLSPDCGAQTETIEQGKTGLRCHTLADYCLGVRMALEGRFDRQYISDRARYKYDMYEVGREYEYVFKTIMDCHRPVNGWYSPVSHMQPLLRDPQSTFMDFVEVGTSDFDTEIELADLNTFGLCIEPLGMYLDRLPNPPNVKKLQKAISNYSGMTKIHYVLPDDIEKYQLPFWVRGCNSIGEPHAGIAKLLRDLNLTSEEIIRADPIQVQPLYDCLLENNVTGIKYLKIDTEGHDWVILDKFANDIELYNRRDLLPVKLQFESNELTDPTLVDKIIERYEMNFGYKLVSRDDNTVLNLG